jgi:hypothetical protein
LTGLVVFVLPQSPAQDAESNVAYNFASRRTAAEGSAMLRLYNPLEQFFTKAWRPSVRVLVLPDPGPASVS